MPAFGRTTLLPIAMTALLGSLAGAQQKECEVNEGSPSEVAKAMLALQVAQSAQAPDAAAKQLKSAIANLEKADPKKNPVGKSFVYGKTLVMWLSQPNVESIANRGTLGYTSNPEGTIDLAAAIDTAFSSVESAMPECATQTSAWRQQKGWVTLINAAIEQSNAGNVDTAEVLAKRSLLLYRGSPYGHMVLGNIAQKRGKTTEALQHYQQTVEIAGTDTSYADVRRNTLLNMGNMATAAAEGATGAEKDSYVKAARSAYEALARDAGQSGNYGDLAQQGLARLAQASGDTAAMKATYQDKLANPDAFTYAQLMSAAVLAANANEVGDATKLFAAAYKLNPYHRDVLANLAIMHIQANEPDQALPFIKKLVEADPSNGENYRLFTHAYAKIQSRLMAANKEYGKKANASKNARAKKAYIDSATISNDSIRQVTDLALKYNQLADTLPVKVTFSEFTPDSAKATVAGSIENLSDASKTYTMTVEFLDKAGNVVTSQETNVGPVTAKGSGRFSVTAAGQGIIAFRYKPVN